MSEAQKEKTDSSAETVTPTFRQLLGRLTRFGSYAAATLVIVLALLVGIARLLLPIVPEYRAEIRRWAQDATGFSIEFERISASWPISGPELSLYNVTIADPDDGQPLLTAGSFRVGVSLLRMLRDRQVALSRVSVSDTQLEIQHDPSGTFLIQGRPLAELLRLDEARNRELPELRVNLSDIAVQYEDTGRTGRELPVQIEQLDIELDPDTIRVEGDLELSGEYGEGLSLTMDLPASLLNSSSGRASGEAQTWQVYASGKRLELENLGALAVGRDLPLRGGRGDVTIWVDFMAREPVNFMVEADVTELVVLTEDDGEAAYRGVSGRVEWQRRLAGWLLSGSQLAISRDDGVDSGMNFTLEYQRDVDAKQGVVLARANLVPLDAAFPIVEAFAPQEFREKYLPDDLRGDVLDLDLSFAPVDDDDPQYRVKARVADLGVSLAATGQNAYGISADLEADQAGGRLQIASGKSRFALPAVFYDGIDLDSIKGFLVWRVTDDQIRVLSDNIDVQTPYAHASARLEIEVPRNGESPVIDLTGVAQATEAARTVQYLPLRRFPPQIVQWLDRAIVSGSIRNADIDIRGPLDKFPFREEEGVFRIAVDAENATLDYADNWPRVEELSGRIVFEGIGIFSDTNAGVIGGLPFRDRQVSIRDLATGILEVSGKQRIAFADALGFLRSTPIAAALGPMLEKVNGDGELDADISLSLPVARAKEFDLKVGIVALSNTIGLDGLNFGFTDVSGSLRIHNAEIFAEDLSARLLDEPVSVAVRPADPNEPLYSHVATVAGVTPVEKWTQTLNLPFPERLDGVFPWRAIALVPARQEPQEANLHILVDSNLDGLRSQFPRPLSKQADQPKQLKMDIAFTGEDQLDVTGDLLDELSWALRLKRAGEQWQIERTAVHVGKAEVSLPTNPGLELSGRFAYLNISDWLDLGDGVASPTWQKLYKEATISVDQLSVFGMVFRDVAVEAATGELDWRIGVEGPTASGRLTIPLENASARAIDIDMRRLYLVETDESQDESADPRNFQRATVVVEDFGLGKMRLGSLKTNISRVPDGVLVNPIQTRAPSFSTEGEGAWLVQRADDTRQRSRLRLALNSSDIKATLTSLGYDPVIEGESANASADLTWEGGPSRDFIDRSEGTIEIKMERGVVLELEPGSGRLLGVLSVAALPRRLSLDFSDVIDEGLGFDSLQGKFSLDGGNAFTCNLSLEGSVADVGVVGRTGLAVEDYQQYAVVRPHVSNVLPLGGAVVGGPGVGAAMWIFSQIFKKPLSTLGESYYEVTGSWSEPSIEKVQSSKLQSGAFSDCEQYLATLQANLNQSQ